MTLSVASPDVTRYQLNESFTGRTHWDSTWWIRYEFVKMYIHFLTLTTSTTRARVESQRRGCYMPLDKSRRTIAANLATPTWYDLHTRSLEGLNSKKRDEFWSRITIDFVLTLWKFISHAVMKISITIRIFIYYYLFILFTLDRLFIIVNG